MSVISRRRIPTDTYQKFYNLLSVQLTDPLSRSGPTKWIFSSYPEEDILEGAITYPIIIIEPADMLSEPHTQTKDKAMLNVGIEVHSNKMIQADQILTQLISILDNFREDLKDQGLDKIQLENTSTDFHLQGGSRVHVRMVNYNMQHIFISGKSTIRTQKTLTSSAVIA